MIKLRFVMVSCLCMISTLAHCREASNKDETMSVSEWLLIERGRCSATNSFNLFQYLGLEYSRDSAACTEHNLISKFIPEYADNEYVNGQSDKTFRTLLDKSAPVFSFDDRLTVIDSKITEESTTLKRKKYPLKGGYTVLGVDSSL